MPHARLCAALDVGHSEMVLVRMGPKLWRAPGRHEGGSVERAVFDAFVDQGWAGDFGEGGLMLTLIKAASIRSLPPAHASTFVESLYFHPARPPMPSPGEMLANVASASAGDISKTYDALAVGPGRTPQYYPSVTWPKVHGLYRALGREPLAAIAAIFATAPYDFRAGWPDLTLWRNGRLIFREVKAPGDRLHAKQKALLMGLLKPLGFDVGVIDVKAAD